MMEVVKLEIMKAGILNAVKIVTQKVLKKLIHKNYKMEVIILKLNK